MVPRHLYLIYQKNEAKNKPTPISVIIGHHPMYYFAAAYTGPADLSELELAGALLEEEVEVVKCETNDLVVPAHAEVCYEGEILRMSGRKKVHSQSSRITTSQGRA